MGGSRPSRRLLLRKRKLWDLVICDFDDTLFPTTELLQYGLGAESVKKQILTQFEPYLLRFAWWAYHHAHHVAIVTNASEGWVEGCLKQCMPRLWNYVQRVGWSIRSARSQFEHQYPPNAYVGWKRSGILAEIHSTERRLHKKNTKLLFIADGPVDKIAFDSFGLERKQMIQMIVRPSFHQLVREWKQLTQGKEKRFLYPQKRQVFSLS